MWLMLLVACVTTPDDELDTGTGDTDTLDTLGARRTDDGLYRFDVSWEPDPPSTGDVTMTLALYADGQPEIGASVAVEPWMPAHGHGVSTPPECTDLGEGLYSCSWSCPMGGEWEIRLEIDGSAGEDEAVFDVTFE